MLVKFVEMISRLLNQNYIVNQNDNLRLKQKINIEVTYINYIQQTCISIFNFFECSHTQLINLIKSKNHQLPSFLSKEKGQGKRKAENITLIRLQTKYRGYCIYIINITAKSTKKKEVDQNKSKIEN